MDGSVGCFYTGGVGHLYFDTGHLDIAVLVRLYVTRIESCIKYTDYHRCINFTSVVDTSVTHLGPLLDTCRLHAAYVYRLNLYDV